MNVAGSLAQPPTLAQFGYSTTVVDVDLEVGQPLQDLRDHLGELDARQVRAHAAVDAHAERQMPVRVAVDHERVGIGECVLVAARGDLAEQHAVALAHRAALELEVLGDGAGVRARRRVEAEELLGGRDEQVGIVEQPLLVVGDLRQVQQRCPMSAVVVSTPPPTVMNTIDSAVSRGMRSPSISWCVIALMASSRGECSRSGDLFADAHHHVAELGLGGTVLRGATRVRGHVVERVGDHAPVVFGEPEPLEGDRAGDRAPSARG